MTAGETARVTVAIACFDEGRWDRLLAAVGSAGTQHAVREVVVAVDHNPRLAARLRARFAAAPAVRVLESDRAPGASGTRNAAAATAAGEFLAFLDDDAVASPGWTAAAVAALDAHPAAVGAGGPIEPDWERATPRWFPREFGWVVGGTFREPPAEPVAVRNVWAANLLVRRDVFEACGGFREDFGKLGAASEPEDTELCLRLARSVPGGHWRFAPGAVVRHHVPAGRATVRFFVRRCWSEGVGKARLAAVAAVPGDATSDERDYVRTVLPAGLRRCAAEAAGGDATAIARAAATVGGLAVTAAGFAAGRARTALAVRRPALAPGVAR